MSVEKWKGGVWCSLEHFGRTIPSGEIVLGKIEWKKDPMFGTILSEGSFDTGICKCKSCPKYHGDWRMITGTVSHQHVNITTCN